MYRRLLLPLVTAFVLLGAEAAFALPIGAGLPHVGGLEVTPHLTRVSGGCGPFRHRGFYGYCRLNLVRPYGPYGGYRPFRFYRPFIFIRRPFFGGRPF